ncbi:terpene synthase [Anthonomus grandis grandis]|uniref:terpene synthase n=1 Tax=Anthonomus grandis grandis TaxID=2921223 RepID=UPI002164F982|nr:terpene synthase [Anthonomus grandis grandis]
MANFGKSSSFPNVPHSRSNDKNQDEKLLEPLSYILQVPGKENRPKLARAFNFWLQVPEEKLNMVADIVQLLHNASLLIDDIQDSSILRRGIPVAHSIYGIPSTINAANYASFIALERVQLLEHPEAVSIALEQILELYRGQGMEIYWRDNFSCPTEEEYKQMVIKKTGGLFMFAIRLMQLFSSNKEDFTKITAILGLYFQIRDDYINLNSKYYMLHKSYCEDLTEGKFSFPIIHAIKSRPDDQQIIHILRQRPKDVEVKKYCVALLEKFGSFDYTRQTLQDLELEAREEIKRLGPNKLMEDLLDSLSKME